MKPSFSAKTLSNSTIEQLGELVQRPTYDRNRLRPHTVHIGVGGFHRAHQAVYLDDLLQRRVVSGCGECGMGVLPADVAMRDALEKQDFLYTVLERSADEQKARVIGSIIDYRLAPQGVEQAIAQLADEDTRLVSLTITEGGYFINEGTGKFASDSADIQHDLHHANVPLTSIGLISAALKRRRDSGLPPFTVMSCDNLQGNGHVMRQVLLGLAELQDSRLARWIEQNVAFPNSMVDRITPATTLSDKDHLRSVFGIADAWPVVTEPFRQWVIEDNFCNGRPPWEEVGAEIVSDVLPYELMKMRLLNASHMAMAYLGSLAGFTFAHEVAQDEAFDRFIQAFMDEVTPIIPSIPNVSVEGYKTTLQERFANPTINDRLGRLCSEGSAKVPKWVLPSAVELAERGAPNTLLALIVAGWIRYLQADKDDRGRPIEVVDAKANELRTVAMGLETDPRPFLALNDLFGSDYFRSVPFTNEVERAFKSLKAHGARKTILDYTELKAKV